MIHSRPSCVATFAALIALCSPGTFAQSQAPIAEWADSPEAYFLTLQERNEWFTLSSNQDREQFRERYWARRDPTPATPRNEFKEIVDGRIAVADQRFTLDGVRGSYTARGIAFIVLGSPAYVSSTHNQPVQPGPGAYNLTEGNETFITWTYDPLRTPKILEALHRASIQLTFRIEPSLRRDVLENPGLFNKLRDDVAELTLVSRPSGASRAELAVDALPGPALPKTIEQQLDSSGQATLATATIWRDDDSPTTLVWLHALEPSSTSPLMLYGRVRDKDQKTVASVAREARPALGFTTHGQEMVVGSQLPLPPGSYDATFVVVDSNTGKTVAGASGRIVVPPSGSPFHVSSLLLTNTLAKPDTTSAVSLGGTSLRPRADATFSNSESMWFVFQAIHPKDPSSVKLRMILRKRDGSSLQVTDIPAALQPSGPQRFISGYEVPLKSVPAGEYSLYVTVYDGSQEEVRRADFRVVNENSR